jgi:DNA polymerase-3 subunit epsilon
METTINSSSAWRDALKEIARTLKITRPLTGFDVETTGKWPKYDRIVQIGWRTVTPDLQIEDHDQLINPQRSMPADAYAIHGISDEDVVDAPTFLKFAPSLQEAWAGHDFFGYNVNGFDRKVLEKEYERIRVPFPFTNSFFVDPLRLWQLLEPRTLADAAEHFCGARPTRIHHAGADIEATARVFAAQLSRLAAEVPPVGLSIEELCQRAKSRREADFIDKAGLIQWRDGAARYAFGKYQGETLEEASKKPNHYQWVAWVMRSDFNDDLKNIVKNASAGTYPPAPKKNNGWKPTRGSENHRG